MALVVICASSVLASRRHPRHYSQNHQPSFVGNDKNHSTRAKTTFLEYDTSFWPSSTDDCLRPEVHHCPDAPAYYLHGDQFYDKRCLEALAYLVEPEERAACRARSDCHHARGYDNECLMQLPFDQGFNFDFEEMRRQELEWKMFACHGKTLDQCGRDYSPWWRSRFPSSREDCRIHRRVNKKRQDTSIDSWIPWTIGPHGTLYDNDCLSHFAYRLGMENPGNCTQTNTYATHKAREVPPVELPKTLLHATNPSGIQPHLVLPTGVTDPDRLATTPLATYIPVPHDSIADIIPETFTTGIPIGRQRKRDDIPSSSVRTLTQTANALATFLPLVSRARGPTTDEWSCMWDVDATLPDPALWMFDATFGDGIIDKTPLVTQSVAKGELEDLSECSNVIEEEIEESLID